MGGKSNHAKIPSQSHQTGMTGWQMTRVHRLPLMGHTHCERHASMHVTSMRKGTKEIIQNRQSVCDRRTSKAKQTKAKAKVTAMVTNMPCHPWQGSRQGQLDELPCTWALRRLLLVQALALATAVSGGTASCQSLERVTPSPLDVCSLQRRTPSEGEVSTCAA